MNNYTLCQNLGSAAMMRCAHDSPIEGNVEYNITSPVQDSVLRDNVNSKVTVVLSIFVDDYVLENAPSVFCRIFRTNATGDGVEVHASNPTILQLESQTTTTRGQSSLPLTTTDYDNNTSTNAGRRSCVHLCLVTLLVLLQTYLWQSMLAGG